MEGKDLHTAGRLIIKKKSQESKYRYRKKKGVAKL
jgi:hypothetical protein